MEIHMWLEFEEWHNPQNMGREAKFRNSIADQVSVIQAIKLLFTILHHKIPNFLVEQESSLLTGPWIFYFLWRESFGDKLEIAREAIQLISKWQDNQSIQ